MSCFPELTSQIRAHKILTSFLKTSRIPQALLFEGAAGLGKRHAAEKLAQALFCQNPEAEGGSCGLCLSCQKMTAHQHPDLIVVAPDGNTIKIEQIRSLQEKSRFRPVEATLKIILIDPADKMNAAAANSLLKTLEEPPPYLRIFLISAKPSALLPTVRSRCQNIPFSPLSHRQLIALLIQNKGHSPHDAARIAIVCNHEVSAALAIDIDQATTLENKLYSLVSSQDPFETSATFSNDKAALEQALAYLRLWVRDVLVYQRLSQQPPLDPDSLHFPWRSEAVAEWAQKMSSSEISQFLSDLQSVSLGQDRNLNRPLSLETLLLQLHKTVSV